MHHPSTRPTVRASPAVCGAFSARTAFSRATYIERVIEPWHRSCPHGLAGDFEGLAKEITDAAERSYSAQAASCFSERHEKPRPGWRGGAFRTHRGRRGRAPCLIKKLTPAISKSLSVNRLWPEYISGNCALVLRASLFLIGRDYIGRSLR